MKNFFFQRLDSFLIIIILSLLLMLPLACADHDIGNSGMPFPVDCTGLSEISYSVNVKPIVESKCALPDCHNGGNSLPDWTVTGNLQGKKNEIQRRITLPLNHPDKMPRTGSITDAERQTIYCWIEQGAKDN